MHSVLRVKIFLFSKTRYGLFDLPERDNQSKLLNSSSKLANFVTIPLKFRTLDPKLDGLSWRLKEEVVAFQVQLFIRCLFMT